MPFIGQQPITGAYSVLDDITTSATATYNLQLNSAAYSPASANNLLVSLNGVIQKPGSSFTISGSQITFSSALTSSDSIDFIIALGDVLSVGTPTDGSVSTASLAPSAVTDAKIAGMSASKLTGTVSNSQIATGAGGKLLNVYMNKILTDLEVGNNTRYNWTQSQITLTPTSTNSRFWLFLTTFSQSTSAATTGNLGLYRLSGASYGTTTEIPAGTWQQRLYNARSSFDASQNVSFQYYDSPATTDSIRYVFYLERNSGSDSVWIGNTSTSRPSYLTIFEFDTTTITTGSDGI